MSGLLDKASAVKEAEPDSGQLLKQSRQEGPQDLLVLSQDIFQVVDDDQNLLGFEVLVNFLLHLLVVEFVLHAWGQDLLLLRASCSSESRHSLGTSICTWSRCVELRLLLEQSILLGH